MLIQTTEEVVAPCSDCDYAPAFCGNDVENCLAFGSPKTPEEEHLHHIHAESRWVHEIEEKQLREEEQP